jgi:hypothetical protein
VLKNLHGARERLADAVDAGSEAGIDVRAIVAAIDARLDLDARSPGAIPLYLSKSTPGDG